MTKKNPKTIQWKFKHFYAIEKKKVKKKKEKS